MIKLHNAFDSYNTYVDANDISCMEYVTSSDIPHTNIWLKPFNHFYYAHTLLICVSETPDEIMDIINSQDAISDIKR